MHWVWVDKINVIRILNFLDFTIYVVATLLFQQIRGKCGYPVYCASGPSPRPTNWSTVSYKYHKRTRTIEFHSPSHFTLISMQQSRPSPHPTNWLTVSTKTYTHHKRTNSIHPHNHAVETIILNNFKLLQNDPETGRIFLLQASFLLEAHSKQNVCWSKNYKFPPSCMNNWLQNW